MEDLHSSYTWITIIWGSCLHDKGTLNGLRELHQCHQSARSSTHSKLSEFRVDVKQLRTWCTARLWHIDRFRKTQRAESVRVYCWWPEVQHAEYPLPLVNTRSQYREVQSISSGPWSMVDWHLAIYWCHLCLYQWFGFDAQIHIPLASRWSGELALPSLLISRGAPASWEPTH